MNHMKRQRPELRKFYCKVFVPLSPLSHELATNYNFQVMFDALSSVWAWSQNDSGWSVRIGHVSDQANGLLTDKKHSWFGASRAAVGSTEERITFTKNCHWHQGRNKLIEEPS
ncbi:hypothetical protein J6590_085943 [Homalodisca vitripennis]|nr:hypothetical protein J6590_085943 [Homalodisca vitripennis]